tara:strand:- start:1183 stop:1479 length:297 start_codon:yes stop_codon:yes gene_type:complete
MIIYGRREYGIIVVTLFLGFLIRGIVDLTVYEIQPFSRDIVKEIWRGEFLFDKYWQFTLLYCSIFGYVWGKMCGAHFKVICKRDEIEKGTLCYRILGF